MTHEELKPCPFCGQSVEYDDEDAMTDGWFLVGCGNPDCCAMMSHRSEEQLFSAWNNRYEKQDSQED